MATSIASRPAPAPTVTIWSAEPTTNDWRAEAIAEYERARAVGQDALRAELAGRVRDLTGRAVRLDSVVVTDQGSALAWVDGVKFQLEGLELTIVRPCVHCGVDEVTSPPIRTRADLGRALSAWRPRCGQCELEDELGDE
jgi:hypothetical protein